MSNRFPGKPPTQPHQTDAIPLPLQAALTSLNVSLEEELTRYRRYRQGYTPALKSYALTPTAQGNSGKTLDWVSPPPPERPKPNSSPVRETLETASESPGSLSPSANPDWGTALSTSFADQNLAEPDTGFEPDSPPEDYLESSEELLRSLAEEEEDEESLTTPPTLNPWLTPLGIGSTLLLILLCITFGVIFFNPSLMRYLFPNRPFREPNPTVPESAPEPTPTPANSSEVSQSLSLPPSEFGQLTLESLSILDPKQPPQPSPMASPVVAKSPVEDASTTTSKSKLKSGLNLRVLSLPVFSAAPEPQSAPPQAPQVAEPPAPLPPPPVARATAPLNPQELPQLQAAAPIVPPQAPSFAQPVPPQSQLQGFAGSIPIPVDMPPEQEWMPEPVATVPEVQDLESYYVVANYEDGTAMAKIQALVPDAYLRNFADGIYVQLGVFDHRGMAEAFLDELKIEGISAKIYEGE
jgi:hypothetical protein